LTWFFHLLRADLFLIHWCHATMNTSPELKNQFLNVKLPFLTTVWVNLKHFFLAKNKKGLNTKKNSITLYNLIWWCFSYVFLSQIIVMKYTTYYIVMKYSTLLHLLCFYFFNATYVLLLITTMLSSMRVNTEDNLSNSEPNTDFHSLSLCVCDTSVSFCFFILFYHNY